MTDPTPRDREIIRLARREVDPAHAAEFAPITRGPVVAVLGLMAIGVIAVPYVAWQAIRNRAGASRPGRREGVRR
jgi:hypothetical protein